MNIFKKKKDFNKKKFLVKTIVLTLLTTLILSAFLPHFSACGTNLIGNNVWEDLNGDGINLGEPGIEGVTVELYKCDNTYVASTTTNRIGNYEFADLPPGNYYLIFILPSGFKFTLQDQGTSEGLDSDADPTTGKTICTYLGELEQDYDWDTGLVKEKVEECNPCKGKVTELTLRYDGTETAQITVTDKKGEVEIFDDEVDPNEEFTLKGFDTKGTLGTEIMIYVDDNINTKIHTSCSKPIGPGMVFGDFTVVEGYSKEGGLICTYEPPVCQQNNCEGKVTQLTLSYDGTSTAMIRVEQKKKKVVVFNEEVDPNEEFTFYGVDKKGTLGKEIKIYVNDVLNTKIHTSCSKPIGPGIVFGDFTVIEGYSDKGGLIICSNEPSSECQVCQCKGKVTQLTLSYDGTTTAQIRVEQKKDNVIVFNEFVDPNVEFTFNGMDDKGTLGTEIMIYVNDGLNTKIHTSCSQPIGPGMEFGDFTVVEGYSKEGGKLL